MSGDGWKVYMYERPSIMPLYQTHPSTHRIGRRERLRDGGWVDGGESSEDDALVVIILRRRLDGGGGIVLWVAAAAGVDHAHVHDGA